MPIFTAEVRVAYHGTVEIEAADEEAAEDKAKEADWEDNGLAGFELVDWQYHRIKREGDA